MNREIIDKIKNINGKKTQNPKACVITFGCQQNESDSEKIKGMLNFMGYEIDGCLDLCEVIVVNTCAVREHAELKTFSRVGNLKNRKQKNKDLIIGICGCMAEQEHTLDYIRESLSFVDFTLGARSLFAFPEIFYETLINKTKSIKKENLQTDIIDEELPAKRDSSFKAWVSVMYGCDNFCSYCVVPYTRGRERSRSGEKILDEITGLVNSGYKDITLLGQNVNSYKDPQKTNYDFARLLGEIIKIKGDYWLRFITSHPKDISDGLIWQMGESEKFAHHIHLPVQAGSDRILKLMNRGYTRENYLALIDKLRNTVKDIAVTTDIIIGFPGETESDFIETLDLVKLVKFDNIFPFIYSKRKNTPAEKMEDKISRKEKTDRFAGLVKIQKEISADKNREYEGKTIKVLAEGEYKGDPGLLSGRTSSHKLTVFKGSAELFGSFVNVKINEGKLHGLYGEIVF